jgi:hypothetical protein
MGRPIFVRYEPKLTFIDNKSVASHFQFPLSSFGEETCGRAQTEPPNYALILYTVRKERINTDHKAISSVDVMNT